MQLFNYTTNTKIQKQITVLDSYFKNKLNKLAKSTIQIHPLVTKIMKL